MKILIWAIVSVLAHVIFIGGVLSYRTYYHEPKKKERIAQEKKEADAKAKGEAEQKKVEQKGTATVVGPDKPPEIKGAPKPEDETKPTGREEDYKAPKKDEKPLGEPAIDLGDEFQAP